MVGNYRRPAYTPTWQQRIYPRQEPTFDVTITSPEPAAAIGVSRATVSPQEVTSPSSTSSLSSPTAPPPIYYPGEAQLARTRSNHPTRLGHIPSINVARSQTATIPFRSHPTLRHGWRRFVRVEGWYRCLIKREPEVFESSWPVEFGGRKPQDGGDDGDVDGGLRISRSISRRSGASAQDSGIALTPPSSSDWERHPLERLFEERVHEVNEVLAKALVPTRVMLAVLEIVDVLFLVLLVVALGVEKGRQRGFLEGVEVALVLIILGNGAMVNAVRMKRWALAKQLRTMARDWSPLPITSSTNQGLLNNFLGEVDEEALAERMRGKDQPTLRWSLRGLEGSWWLSYRPVMKVELVTPTGSVYGPTVVRRTSRRVPVPTVDVEAEPEPFVPPSYEA
ncbi:hypothetical protein P7C70_g6015, partial [Phenoliferia sp. Uapishka_3]